MSSQVNAYSFDQQFKMSEGVAESASVTDIILKEFPGAFSVEAATPKQDRSGVDRWVKMRAGHFLGIDVKAQSVYSGCLPLETWSVVESKRVGWTRDPDKRTDYILWFWEATGHFCLVPFPLLCTVFREKWQDWCKEYKPRKQYTKPRNGRSGYHSECVFVPIRTVWAEIYRRYSGV